MLLEALKKTAKNPGLTVAIPLQPQTITLRRTSSNVGIFGPVFIDGTVASDIYLSLMIYERISFHTAYGIPMNSVSFQQDCARLRTNNPVICLLHVFEERVVLNRYPVLLKQGFSWQPTSPNFKHLQLFSM